MYCIYIYIYIYKDVIEVGCGVLGIGASGETDEAGICQTHRHICIYIYIYIHMKQCTYK